MYANLWNDVLFLPVNGAREISPFQCDATGSHPVPSSPWCLTWWILAVYYTFDFSSFFHFNFYLFLCICVFCLYVYPPQYMPGAHKCQKKTLDPLELELWMLVNYYVGAGNWNWVPCKSSKCSNLWPMSPAPYPLPPLLLFTPLSSNSSSHWLILK